MASSPCEAVAHYIAQHSDVTAYCVAYSGGMDSHVLLATMVDLLAEDGDVELRAIHIDHGLQHDSEKWCEHAQNVCDALGVPLDIRKVEVVDRGEGPEASARIARYAEFSAVLGVGEHLLLAQHADDQAETFLIQALRGSGPDGLASIPRKRKFAAGFMGRPLLSCSQESIASAATAANLDWIEDPSNKDTRFDRNFLRLELLPLLKTRWPAAAQTLSRAAMRSAAASQTLLGLAQEDLDQIRIRGAAELSVSELKALPRERAYNVLRLWVRQRGLRMPRLQDLAQVISDLVRARHDSNGIVNVRDYEFRRHRDRLFLLPPQPESQPFHHEWEAPFEDLQIPEIGIVLTRANCAEQGVALPDNGTVIVKSRTGGELIKLGEPAFHKAVKKLLQEFSVAPWQRDCIPLLYIDGRLAVVWNIAVAPDFRCRSVAVDSGVDAEPA